MDRAAIVDELTRYFANREDVVAAYLFGSIARGEGRESSDADVAMLLRDGRPEVIADFDRVFEIQEELAGRLGRDVDVVVMNDAPLDLLHRVLRDGVRLLDRDPLERMEFELQARTQYFDFLPILLRYREAVLRRA
jgi:predicted nucleotidyltransferase